MAFQSLSTRIASLPLVLAGPLLRRTENDNVTVWLALKSERNVTLEVYDAGTTPVLHLAGSRSTVKVGANLHIVAVTAKSVNSKVLSPDITYTYRLQFDDGSSIKKLDDAGIMHTDANKYDIYTYVKALPSFSLPPSDIKDLRIIHVSCRKPHGGKVDAFVAIDNILTESFANSSDLSKPLSKTRPHQLFHTGDQIYADDVDDTLLYMLNDASKALLGWNEELPLSTVENPDGYLSTTHIKDMVDGQEIERLPDVLLPGKREKIVTDNGFTEGISHLMTLGEYICMYLFAWSDVLWPEGLDKYPTFKQVYPKDPATKIIFNDSGNTINPRTVPTDEANKFPENLKIIQGFRSTLPRVRKVLANVPSYMMCDDHEVTDDWFLNLILTQRTLSNRLTSRIMQNGLAAFTLCQGWGNKPLNFEIENSAEANLLKSIDILADQQLGNLSTVTTWNTIRSTVLPLLTEEGENHLKLVNELEFNFQIDFNNYKVIVLDTRNQRRFLKNYVRETSSADLMSMESLNKQVPELNQELSANIKFTLVVSPSPVLGHRFVEAKVQEAAFEFIYKVASGLHIVPGAMPFLYSIPSLEIMADKEGWAFGKTIYQDLLHRLAMYRKIIVLSGDVHYSFSGKIDYWNERNTVSPSTSKIIQLTASPSKNSGHFVSKNVTRISNYLNSPALENVPLPLANNLPTLEFLGWQSNGYHIDKLTTNLNNPIWISSYVKGYPDAHLFNSRNERISEFSQEQVQWRYRMSFAKDDRSAEIRGTQKGSGSGVTNSILKSAEQHQNRQDHDAYRIVVGNDAIGELTFYDIITGGTSYTGVKHNLWYNTTDKPNENLTEFLPYTMHEYSLNLPPVSGATVPGYEE